MGKRVTTVVNLKDGGCDVYIGGYPGGEMSRWGNPYRISTTMTRAQTIKAYKALLWARMQQPEFITELMRLDGKRLGCWCKPDPCHGDVLVAAIEYLKTQRAAQEVTRLKEEDERHAAAVPLD